MKDKYIELGGGIDERYSNVRVNPGSLIDGVNIECKTEGGYRRSDGYTKFDPDPVPGSGPVRGVWRYRGKVYAFRNNVADTFCDMYSSVGSGWTLVQAELAKDGKYEFENTDFAGTQKMYGASGVHPAFEYDGTTFTSINTGMAVDHPSHLTSFKKHLFLSFDRSLQNSPLGDPTGTWTVNTGANEVALGDTITGFMRMSGGTLGIFSRNSTNLLYGSSTADFVMDNLKEHGLQIGAIAGSLQQMGSRLYYLDDRGVVDFYTSQNFGDFDDATISHQISRLIRANAHKVISSCVIRNKTQYRLFFNDGTGLIFSFSGNTLKGITRLNYKNGLGLPLIIHCVASTENDLGQEEVLLGGDDGCVYIADSGDSFDGYPIEAILRTVYTHLGALRVEKRVHRAIFDMSAKGGATVLVKPDFRFNKPTLNDYIAIDLGQDDGVLGQAILGSSKLGSFPIDEGQAFIPGHAEYINITLYSKSIDPAWDIDGINYQFNIGRRLR